MGGEHSGLELNRVNFIYMEQTALCIFTRAPGPSRTKVSLFQEKHRRQK